MEKINMEEVPEQSTSPEPIQEPPPISRFSQDDAYDITSEEFLKTLEALTQHGHVLVSILPGPTCTSFVSTLTHELRQKGYKERCLKKLTYWDGLRDFDSKTVVWVDSAFGVVRVEEEQYRCFREHDMFSISNSGPKFVYLVFPNVLAELQERDQASDSPRLNGMRVVTLGHDRRSSVRQYRFILLRMIREPTDGMLFRVVLARSMRAVSDVKHREEIDTYIFHMQDEEKVPEAAVEECTRLLTGVLLAENGCGFINRDVEDAAKLVYAFSSELTLRLCDVKFLVQHVHTYSDDRMDLILAVCMPEERYALMQTIQEIIVTGKVSEICQHPCLHEPDYLQEFEAFCREEDQLYAVISAVDPQHSLPLLYWSLWAPSLCLYDWCLRLMKDQYTDSSLLSHYLMCSAFLAALLGDCGREDLSGLVTRVRDQLSFSVTTHTTLALPIPCPESRHTECVQNLCDKVTQCLNRGGLFYLADPSVCISPQLLTMTLVDDTIQLALPCQQPYLALRAMGDREVDEVDRQGNTLLHVAAHTGQVQGVKMAIHSGASLFVKNKRGQTAPQLATSRRDQHGESRIPCPESWTRLQTACAERDMAAVKELLCVDIAVFDKGLDGMTPLHLACLGGDTGIASLLMDLGAPVNCVNSLDQTPLHVACQGRHLDVAKLLAEKGCDVNFSDRRGDTALLTVCDSGQTDIADVLLQHGADVSVCRHTGRTPFVLTCLNTHWDMAELLLQNGADINQLVDGLIEDKLATILHWACYEGRTELVDFLVQRHALVGCQTDDGLTPLHFAHQGGHADIVQLLLNNGPDVNRNTNTGHTPPLIAC